MWGGGGGDGGVPVTNAVSKNVKLAINAHIAYLFVHLTIPVRLFNGNPLLLLFIHSFIQSFIHLFIYLFVGGVSVRMCV